ncbi:AAA family ATPase [Patulibacter minatonensis]|uniref:AAA family ATPase n=1 Tax=Patulibacter minatonensis TaxID=298163 RepID=UPI0005649312|nr:AAA family ATPase [Patulibacter minatonensis]
MTGGLRERDGTLALVSAALERARDGRGGAVVVVGDAGTGKTSVLEAARRAAGGTATVAVRAEEMETGVPFGVLDALLRALGDAPGAGDGPDAVDPTVPFVRALRRLERHDGPLLVTLDDLHWADEDSLRVVAFLVRRLAALPVTFVGALRAWPPHAHDLVHALEADGAVDVARLGPLSRDASRALLVERAGRELPTSVARRVWELCGGNPLLTGYVGTALGRGEDPLGDRAVAPPAEVVPHDPGVPGGPGTRLLVGRFAGLDDDALRLARTAGLLGTSFRPEVAVDVAGLPAPRSQRALEALVGSGLVREDGHDRLRFLHPLLVRALHDDVAPAVRRHLHGRAFRELARRGLSAEAVEHAVRADLSGDRDAAGLLERVGRGALRDGAIEAAVRHLGTAVRFLGDDAGAALRTAHAEALCAAGRAADGADACGRVLADAELGWSARIDALTLLGRCRYLTGDPEGGAAALEDAVVLAAEHDPARAVGPLLDQTSSVWVAEGPAAALPLATRARGLARDAAPDVRDAALAHWGSLAAECGEVDGIVTTRELARSGRRPRVDDVPVSELVSPLAVVYPVAHGAQYDERLDDCLNALELVRGRLDDAGAAGSAAMVNLFLGNHLLRRGRLDEALRAADLAGLFSELTPLTIPVAAALRAQALVWSGRADEGLAEAERALRLAPGAWLIRLWSAIPRGLHLLWAGDGASSDAFLDVEQIVDAVGIREPNHTQWTGHAVAAHLLAGRDADARRVLHRQAEAADGHPTRWPAFVRDLSHGRIAEHDGEDEAALAAYERALAGLGDVDLPLQRAEALLAGGALLRRTRASVAARPWLAEALRIADAHGARPIADPAAVELRLAGGRRRRAHDRDRLTAAELRVARAAADGQSNAEIAAVLHLSTNTVATHLKRVYAKLGVAGRHRLRDLHLDAHAAEAAAGP